MYRVLTYLMLILVFGVPLANADSAYFSFTKSNKVNLRSGPGIEYEIKWIYVKKNVPLKVIGKFEQWKKVQDIDGEEGWVYANLLHNKYTYIMINQDTVGYTKSSLDVPNMKIAKHSILKLKSCEHAKCLLAHGNHITWVETKFLWGVLS